MDTLHSAIFFDSFWRSSWRLVASQCVRVKLDKWDNCVLLTHDLRIRNYIIGLTPRSLATTNTRVHYLAPRSILTSRQNPACTLLLPAKAMYKYEHFSPHITFYYFVGWSNNSLHQGYPNCNPRTSIVKQLCFALFLLYLRIKWKINLNNM
jgi:hypothetical protein